MHERQNKAIESFDRETADLGIDPSEIYTADDEFKRLLIDDQFSNVSGMSHSSSTASFNTPL